MPNGDLRAVQLYGKSCNKPHHVDRFNLFICELLIGDYRNKKQIDIFCLSHLSRCPIGFIFLLKQWFMYLFYGTRAGQSGTGFCPILLSWTKCIQFGGFLAKKHPLSGGYRLSVGQTIFMDNVAPLAG